jgi:hypothetical protein
VAKIAAKIAAEIASACRPEDVPNYAGQCNYFNSSPGLPDGVFSYQKSQFGCT